MSIKVVYKKKLNEFTLSVNFSIPDKGITVLFGPSGAGKSSLLNLIAGLNTDGKVLESRFEINNKIYDDSQNKIKLKPWQRNIAYVFQDARLFPHMTVLQNILYGYKRRNSQISTDNIIEKFKIKTLLEFYPGELSGGQKQRVALVRALLSNPDLLILDEPMASLDYKSKQELLPYIECIHKELTIPVIHVSHDIKEVLRLADYIIIMQQGEVIDQGEIADLCINQPLLTEAEGASFILQGVVTDILEEDRLVGIQCEKDKILITDQNMQLNQRVRVLIHARDVSLCLSPPQDSSILNCLPITVRELEYDNQGKIKVLADMSGQTIVSMISHRSARKLQVEKGREMYAQFKATALIK